jgi:hypothetical protein
VAASNIQVASDSQLTASIPAHNAQVVHVHVTAAGGTSQPGAGDRFTAGWNGWESFFVDVAGRPEPAALGVGQLDVFDWTPDGTIYGFAYTGVWHPQRPLYLSGYGGPGAVASGPGASDLFETSYPNWTLLYTTTTPKLTTRIGHHADQDWPSAPPLTGGMKATSSPSATWSVHSVKDWLRAGLISARSLSSPGCLARSAA